MRLVLSSTFNHQPQGLPVRSQVFKAGDDSRRPEGRDRLSVPSQPTYLLFPDADPEADAAASPSHEDSIRPSLPASQKSSRTISSSSDIPGPVSESDSSTDAPDFSSSPSSHPSSPSWLDEVFGECLAQPHCSQLHTFHKHNHFCTPRIPWLNPSVLRTKSGWSSISALHDMLSVIAGCGWKAAAMICWWHCYTAL